MMFEKRPLSFKLAAVVLAASTLVGGGMFTYNFLVSRDIIVRQAEENARTLGREVANHMAAQLKPIEQVVRNIALALEDATLTSGDVTSLARRVVLNNQDVYAMAIAFEPYSMAPDTLYFAPYCHRSPSGVRITSLGGEDFRYFYMDWYQLPKELGSALWTEPYYDEARGRIMTTFAAPFYRMDHGERRFTGVVAADITLDWLQDVVGATSLYETGYSSVISRNGTFIHHPLKNLVLNETIFSLAQDRDDPQLAELGYDMIAGGSAFLERKSVRDDKDSFLFYTPLPVGGWSLIFLFPKDEVLAEVDVLSRTMLVMGLCGFLLLVASVGWAAHRLTRPLRRLTQVTHEIAGGNLDAVLPEVGSSDEVGDLTRSFDHLKTSLKAFIKDLKQTTTEKERIESELRIARDIQMGILPKLFPAFPDHEEFDVFASIEPARQVGGDLYDFFFIDERHFCFLIGDVSGKGVPAAFFMAVTKTLLKAVAEKDYSPGQILAKVNDDLSEENESCMFVTLFLGILDIDTGMVRYASAGHNPPVLVTGDEASWLPSPREPIAGIVPETEYTTLTLTMKPGDILFLYTDGVSEAMNEAEDLFTDQRLLEHMHTVHGQDASEVVKGVEKAIETFTGGAEQSDDITMLALQFSGKTK